MGNDHQPPAKCYRNFGEDSLAGSQLTPGGFCSLYSDSKAGGTDKVSDLFGNLRAGVAGRGKNNVFFTATATRETTTPASQVNTTPIFT